MKIGIINVYNRNTVNYGNTLQTYALNRYIRCKYADAEVETILWSGKNSLKITSYIGAAKHKISKIFKKDEPTIIDENTKEKLKELLSLFRKFADENIVTSQKTYTLRDLSSSAYDAIIVGSDIVWRQSRNIINRILFLDHNSIKKQKKISYAASFGTNYIPKENRKYIKKYLNDFSAISVRESQSVDLLNELSIDGVKHVLDPTMLLSKTEWESIEKMPDRLKETDSANRKYVFIYLLKYTSERLDTIIEFCKKNDIISIFVPFICSKYKSNAAAADITIENCSPNEWLWLIHNAEYVITDNFHGIVLSTVFQKKFFAISRIHAKELNVRLYDFLQEKRNESIDFIDQAIGQVRK